MCATLTSEHMALRASSNSEVLIFAHMRSLIVTMRSEYQMLQTLAGKEGLMHKFGT